VSPHEKPQTRLKDDGLSLLLATACGPSPGLPSQACRFVTSELYGDAHGTYIPPGWHGYPPSGDQYVPPISLPAPTEGVTTTTANAPAIWVELDYSDGRTQTVKGFAMAWTNSMVLAQWVELSRAREV
jgi:hypothetical protein